MLRSILKAIILVGILVVLLLAVVLYVAAHRSSGSAITPPPSAATAVGEAVTKYHESDEVLDPYDLSKNPYKWKDHSGILDNVEVPLVMSNGTRVGQVAYPGGCLKFEKMLDEHTAIYSVLVGEGSVVPDGEIAAILPNSDPPDSRRPWRVFVEGPMEAVNGFGSTITVGAVRFEGYYIPQPKPAETATLPAAQMPAGPGKQWTGARIRWTAMSHTAYAITGDVETSPDGIVISHSSYPLVYVRDLRGDELQDSAQALDVQMPSSSGVEGRLFRTSIPGAARLVNGNTICGGENAAWVLALTARGDGSGSASGDWLYLAFFSGNAEPILQPQAIGSSKALCGTYNYQKTVSNPTQAAPS